MTDLATASHYLYRLLAADGELLYVGVTTDPHMRLSAHRASEWGNEIADIAVSVFDSREAVLEAEREAIKAQHPKFNVLHRSMPSSRVRTVRVPDELWQVAQDTAWGRRQPVSDPIRLALRAYVADPAAFEAACRIILGES